MPVRRKYMKDMFCNQFRKKADKEIQDHEVKIVQGLNFFPPRATLTSFSRGGESTATGELSSRTIIAYECIGCMHDTQCMEHIEDLS